MKLSTKRLELTNFKAEYAEEFTKALSDPKNFLFLPESIPTINDVENLTQWFIEKISILLQLHKVCRFDTFAFPIRQDAVEPIRIHFRYGRKEKVMCTFPLPQV